MLDPKSTSGRRGLLSPLIVTFAAGLWVFPLTGQELPLKRALPGSGPYVCPTIEPPADPTADERAQARRLGSDASQAMILGNMQRARDLLARANEVDPSSADLAYRFAGVLEDLGDGPGAVAQFCRVLALGPGPGMDDAETRLQRLAEADRVAIPEEAVVEFEMGLEHFDADRLEPAVEAFGLAYEMSPEWADALYNRGVVHASMGLSAAAIADLQEYLILRPNALDAMQVSQRIGQLESPGRLPSPGTALALGVIPGMGQFYSGRALGGVSVLALAGGAVAAGFLIEEVTVRCLDQVPSGQDCPPNRIIDQATDKPYLAASLGVAAVVTVVGAVEAFIKAKRMRFGQSMESASLDLGSARLVAPSVTARGRNLDLNLIRVSF